MTGQDGERERLAILLPDLGGGGAERVAIAMAHGFHEQGHPVDLVLGKAAGALLPAVPPGIRIIDLHAPRGRQMVRPLAAYLRKERPAALHAMMWPLPMFALIARGVAGIRLRIVASEHTTLSKVPRGAWGRRLTRMLLKLFYHRLDAVVGVSAGVATDLERFAMLRTATVQVIHNPLQLPSEHGAPVADDAWPTNGGRILAVGSLKSEKNYPLLLAAMAIVVRQQSVSLVILGDGDLRGVVEREITQRGLERQVRLAGFTTDPWPYYRAADLFVLSSDHEGLPTVLIEALHAGLPIVSTDCESGPREILDHGRYGRLVPPGDASTLAEAIVTALDDTPDKTDLQARAEQLAGALPLARHLDVLAPRHAREPSAESEMRL